MFVRQLREGDTVLLRENVEIEVKGTLRGEEGPEQKPVTYIFDTADKQWSLHPGDIVELVHRPWPKGKTERDMKYAAHDAFMEFVVKTIGRPIVTACQHESFRAFLDAYEAYELGKPGPVVKPEPLGKPIETATYPPGGHSA